MNENELFEKLDQLRSEIGNVEGITYEKKKIIWNNIKASLKALEVPDFYYDTRERVTLAVRSIVAVLFIAAVYLAFYATNHGIDVNLVITIGIILALFCMVKMPSIEELTEKAVRSENETIRKLFIPQKN